MLVADTAAAENSQKLAVYRYGKLFLKSLS